LRVDCLNAVLNVLSEWDVPMIMIPGNHDQVTLNGIEHALTPLQNAYRINIHEHSNSLSDTTTTTTPNNTIPGILLFSQPTKFNNALFVPHIRDIAAMQSILQSPKASTSQAIFIHADVTGAYMNDLIMSTGGIAPSYFPPNTPIYSGHFHKPHVVEQPLSAPGVCIRYVGSPYETSLAEAGQDKALLVLDSDCGWSCVERIPLYIGRKHWKAGCIEDLLDLETNANMNVNDSITGSSVQNLVSSGDRVVVSVDQEEVEIVRDRAREDGEICQFDAKVKDLRSIGVSVEIRDAKSGPITRMGSTTHFLTDDSNVNSDIKSDLDWLLVEDMSPQTTWSNFLQNEVERTAISNITASKLLDAGNDILAGIECGTYDSVSDGKIGTDVVAGEKNSVLLSLDEITIQGFGPFKNSVSYPLKDRGIVLVKGLNQDGRGSDSNGTGKSSLAMSALWALTGSIDPRPVSDSKVSDIVNDLSKSAKVSIRGTINHSPFVVSRTKTSSKGSLTFVLDDMDLTRQSVKETQQVIDEKLGVGSQVLSRTIFHGQHSLNGLLEATDAKFKDELSLIVPLKIWQDSASHTRGLCRSLAKKASEIDGMISIRNQDIETLKRKFETTKDTVALKEDEVRTKEKELQKTESIVIEDEEEICLESLRQVITETVEKLKFLESTLQSELSSHDAEIKPIQLNLDRINSDLNQAKAVLQNVQRGIDRIEVAVESAQESLKSTKVKWDVIELEGDAISSFTPPNVCPTCKQPMIDESSHNHIHDEMQTTLTAAYGRVEELNCEITRRRNEFGIVQSEVDELQVKKETLTEELEKKAALWYEQYTKYQSDIDLTRERYSTLSIQFSNELERVNRQNRLEAFQSNANAELKASFDRLEAAKIASESILQEVNDMKTSIHQLEVNKEISRERSGILSKVVDYFGARGVQTYILQNTITALQFVAQTYLDELSDGTLRLQLKLDDGDRIIRSASVLSTNGVWVERPLSSLSGGQWRRCSLSLSLGFSDLIARRGRLCPSLLVLDEPLTHLDSGGRDNVGKVLRKLIYNQSSSKARDGVGIGGLTVSTILIILQDLVAEELSESFDRVDEVVRSEGHSRVVIDE